MTGLLWQLSGIATPIAALRDHEVCACTLKLGYHIRFAHLLREDATHDANLNLANENGMRLFVALVKLIPKHVHIAETLLNLMQPSLDTALARLIEQFRNGWWQRAPAPDWSLTPRPFDASVFHYGDIHRVHRDQGVGFETQLPKLWIHEDTCEVMQVLHMRAAATAGVNHKLESMQEVWVVYCGTEVL